MRWIQELFVSSLVDFAASRPLCETCKTRSGYVLRSSLVDVQFYTIDATVGNRLSMKLWLGSETPSLPNSQSLFLIEELADRRDYRLIGKVTRGRASHRALKLCPLTGNAYTSTTREHLLDLFAEHADQFTDDERFLFRLFNQTLSMSQFFFLGPNLIVELMVKHRLYS